ncbi:Glutathione S-transferase 1 [Fulvia fulva]|uniref:Glutathione S-transferase 1 n=1 Tax=Passalora fulva TaxID=5499 RepID=A0A9Q8P5L4_PASFU|nr:Glutathione S-transferase 1 [Fulvia fulva]KAK4631658.1 Glutathione S-transferase 1 [Fulvia fulva]KAK4632540.1 Glutathione S-transferase 1 [Fulvia fulva]UJO14054.1 Glutathione S-transferase 1 [Fulvia fulva]WPV11686.1 Glutathione S-transferase 1 [Fulvia fulva]WPV26340.1 Glutathione S-transferase 1 [Fulvia fulva]
MAESTPKITLHWLDKSRSQRVVWLLEECKGIDYDVKIYKRNPMLAPPELKKVHPLGKSPIITVETAATTGPIVLAETGALTEYLTDYFAQHLVPTRYKAGKENQVGGETEEWLRYRYFMHYAEGSLMTLLMIGLFIDQIRNAEGAPFFVKPITRMIAGRVDSMFLTENYATHFSFLESQIASSPNGGKYLCGEKLTSADIVMSFPLMAAKTRDKIDKSKYPKLTAYVELLENSEGYKKSIKKIEDVSGEKLTSVL